MSDQRDLLLDRLDIDDRLTRYATAIDGHRWALLDEVFAPDAHLDYRAASGIAGGYAEVKEWLAATLPAMFVSTQHLVANREVSIDGDAARSVAMFHNPSLVRPEVLPASVGPERESWVFTCGGWYHDRWERRPEGWRIVERIEDVTWWTNPIPGLPAVPPGLPDDVDVS